MSNRPVFAVLTAAGSGTRLGKEMPKSLVPIADRPMILHAAQGLLDAGVAGIVITAPQDHLDTFAQLITQLTATRSHTLPVSIVPGGVTRQGSVANGLAAIPSLATETGHTIDEHTPILIHDAARALTPLDVIHRVVKAVEDGSQAVIPALPVSDTLKVISRKASRPSTLGTVASTADRTSLVAVQTPQGFPWHVIRRAHANAADLVHDESLAATDDAGLVEALGRTVDIVEGAAQSLKITTPWDLQIAEHLVGQAR